jgi:pyruvate dehydrogenase E2 component (dihydrolipoamide acetyltransferase)
MIYDVVMPQLGLTMEEGSVVSWNKKAGDWVQKGEMLFTVETDKSVMEVESADSGYLNSIQVEVGKKVKVGTVIATLADQQGEVVSQEGTDSLQVDSAAQTQTRPAFESTSAAGEASHWSAGSAGVSPPANEVSKEFAASPRARKLAEELGIDIALLKPARGNRIVETDVRRFQESRKGTPPQAPAQETTVAPSRAATTRKIVSQRMTASFQTAPHFYLGVEANATEIVKLRDQKLAEFDQLGGLRLTYTDLFLRALAVGLKEHAQVNAYWQNDDILLRDSVDVGFAVQTPDGLIAPVIRNADQLTLLDLVCERHALTDKARTGKLSLREQEGGSATLSNLGNFGIDWFQAILNPPQSVILATGRISKRAVVVNDSLEVCPTVVLSLSVDHRVLDGVAAAIFLSRIKELIENPSVTLL